MKKVVGILRGGTWENYDTSLNDGGKIISFINENLSDKIKIIDILIDKSGVWHLNGLPIKPSDLMNKVDVVWNTIHPSHSVTLSNLSIAHVDTNIFSKTNASKEMLQEHIKKIGIKMPKAFVIPAYQKDFDGPYETFLINKAKEVFNKFSSPWIVKSLTLDKNTAIHISKTFSELIDAIDDCVKHNKSILVEEFILGKNVSVHSVNDYRGENIYSFPPVECKGGIITAPGKFTTIEKEKLIELSKKIHEHVNAGHYLEINFILSPRGIYFTDVNFSPSLDIDSGFHKSCVSVGTGAHDVFLHILERASI